MFKIISFVVGLVLVFISRAKSAASAKSSAGKGVGKGVGKGKNRRATDGTDDELLFIASQHTCLHGYSNGCQPHCHLYEHCWGIREERQNKESIYSDLLSSLAEPIKIETPVNEDGDWRTVYMDDTLFDDREYDERNDHDSLFNGW